MYGWMGENVKFTVNGNEMTPEDIRGVSYAYLKEGDVFELTFEIKTEAKKETVRDTEFTVYWRGCDVVDITPRGEHVRLNQRNDAEPKYYPLPEDVIYTGAANMGPTQQKQ